MQSCFSLLTAAIFLSIVPVAGLAQQDSGIPPMLENQRPMVVPAAKPEAPPPQQTNAPSVKPAKKSKKTKSAKGKKGRKQKGGLANKKKGKPAS